MLSLTVWSYFHFNANPTVRWLKPKATEKRIKQTTTTTTTFAYIAFNWLMPFTIENFASPHYSILACMIIFNVFSSILCAIESFILLLFCRRPRRRFIFKFNGNVFPISKNQIGLAIVFFYFLFSLFLFSLSLSQFCISNKACAFASALLNFNSRLW